MHRVWFAAEVISDINQDKEIYSVIYSWYVVDFGSMTGMWLHTSKISYRFIQCNSMQMFPYVQWTHNTRWQNDASWCKNFESHVKDTPKQGQIQARLESEILDSATQSQLWQFLAPEWSSSWASQPVEVERLGWACGIRICVHRFRFNWFELI